MMRPQAEVDLPPALGVGLLRRAIRCGLTVGPSCAALVDDLRSLEDRLVAGRLQLSVVGQFKRGKSTLLNALVGADLLPVGVLPVTAVPTFLERGPRPALAIAYLDGRADEAVEGAGADALRLRLAELVAEEGNPANGRGLEHVRVRLPSAFLSEGMILIDTPGVGSTLQHNTLAAETALPACDAALFVVSPDPPITEVEIGYLARVRAVASRIVVVLNKADLLTEAEGDAVEAFLRRTLAERAHLTDAPVFRVSARQALAAKLSGDCEALRRSGLPELEAWVAHEIGGERRVLLAEAVARKARAIVADMRLRADLRLQALQLPLHDLERRRRVFETAVAGFEQQRRIVVDLLSADRNRALAALEEQAERSKSTLNAMLESRIDARIATGQEVRAAWNEVRQELPGLCENELNMAVETWRRDLAEAFDALQARADELIDLVRRTAAEIMEVPFRPSPRASAFEAKLLPYWVGRRPDALNALEPGAFDALLPPPLRRRHARRRTSGAIRDVVLRNVENLRWALRQNLEDAFRRFQAEADARFAASLAATRDAMSIAAERRNDYAAETRDDIDRLGAASVTLGGIEAALAGEIENAP